MSTSSYPFQHTFQWDIWSPSCSNFIMFWPKGRHLAYSSTSFPSFFIIFVKFLHNILYATWTTPSFNCKHFSMCVHTSHRPYGYPPLTLCSWQRTHWNPWCNSQHLCHHSTRCWFSCGTKTITCVSFNHIQLLLLIVDLVFTKDGIGNLDDVVIADPMWANLLPQPCATQGFVAFDAIQIKERSYHNRHPIDQFLPLVIEIFGCLHKHVNVFLDNYANAIWSLKGTKNLHLSTLFTFSRNFFFITL
jgi:hypothetical protein